MSYSTTISSQITITPPLTWAEIKDSPFLPDNARKRNGPDCMFEMETTDVETDEGVLRRTVATGLVTSWEDEARAETLVEDVQKVVDTYGATHEFTGRFHCEGEENDDVWRVYVRDGKATRVDAELTWPSWVTD